jgi:hypothetical protein
MDPVFANLLDVVRIVTFQPTTVIAERERIAQERFRSSDALAPPAASPGAAQKPGRLRPWFRFSLVPRL